MENVMHKETGDMENVMHKENGEIVLHRL